MKPALISSQTITDKLLTYLQGREGELVTVEDIIRHVWGPTKSREVGNVRVLVVALRGKLKAQSLPFDIVNEHGRGYRFRRILPQRFPG